MLRLCSRAPGPARRVLHVQQSQSRATIWPEPSCIRTAPKKHLQRSRLAQAITALACFGSTSASCLVSMHRSLAPNQSSSGDHTVALSRDRPCLLSCDDAHKHLQRTIYRVSEVMTPPPGTATAFSLLSMHRSRTRKTCNLNPLNPKTSQPSSPHPSDSALYTAYTILYICIYLHIHTYRQTDRHGDIHTYIYI